MRKHLWIVVALLAVVALSACGGGKKDAEPAATDSTEQAAGAESADAPSTGDAARGQELFVPTCGACHGPEGLGVENLGKDMTTSEFIAERSDEEMLEFVKVGRAPDDPLNTTGVLMPPKGGNPALSDEQLMDIIAYVRSLQQ